MKYTFATSNQNKINEFKTILGDEVIIQKGMDKREVNGSKDEVILYKSIDAGKGFIVEDTILEVDNEEIVDIKYKIKTFSKRNNKANWIVSIAYNDGESIHIYRGITAGKLIAVENIPNDSFGFDSYFVPNKTNKSLYELSKIDKKQDYCARRTALNNLLNNLSMKSVLINEIPKWEGEYQD